MVSLDVSHNVGGLTFFSTYLANLAAHCSILSFLEKLLTGPHHQLYIPVQFLQIASELWVQ